MKRKIYVIALTLIVLSVIEAGVVSADIQHSETGPYDAINGKKLLFYGENITDITVIWWDYENISKIKTYNASNLNLTSILFTISSSDVWNATYIQWRADLNHNEYHFEGGFPTIQIEEEYIEYNQLQKMHDETRALIAFWIVSNFSKMNSSLVDYTDKIKDELKQMGLTTNQVNSITAMITEGMKGTEEREKQHRVDVISAEKKGWNDAMKLVGIFLGFIIFIVGVWFITKGKMPIMRLNKRKKKHQDTSFVSTIFE